jgi:hypothetical protein
MQWHSRKTTGIAELVDFPEVLLEDFEATHRKDAGKSLQNASAGIKFFPVVDRRVKTVSSNDPGVAEGPPVFSKPAHCPRNPPEYTSRGALSSSHDRFEIDRSWLRNHARLGGF